MFVKGQSGNPGGRPKKDISLTNILKRQAEKKDVEYNGQKIKRKDAIAQKIWQLALSGDLTAMKYIFDRIDGRPSETIKQQIGFDGDLNFLAMSPEDRRVLLAKYIDRYSIDQTPQEENTEDENGG